MEYGLSLIHISLSLGDIIKANLVSEAIIGGIKSLSNAVVGMGKSFVGAVADGVNYNSMIEDLSLIHILH